MLDNACSLQVELCSIAPLPVHLLDLQERVQVRHTS